MDDLSALSRQLLKLFGTTHPIRCSIGICAGFGAKLLLATALAYFPDSPAFKVLSDFPPYYYGLVFAAALMVPIAFGRNGAPEQISHQIKTIETLLNAAKFSPAECRFVWHSLVQKYLAAVEANLVGTPKIELVEETEKEISARSSEPRETS